MQAPLVIVTSVINGRVGGNTTILKLRVALSTGLQLSLTLTTTVFVVKMHDGAGRQRNTPVSGAKNEPGGPVTNWKVSVCGGDSASVAMLVITSISPASTNWSGTGSSTGAVLGANVSNRTMSVPKRARSCSVQSSDSNRLCPVEVQSRPC